MVDWDDFAVHLSEELAKLPDGGTLIIDDPATGRYFQFAQTPDFLLSQLVHTGYVKDGYGTTPEGERALEEAGWTRPDNDNWQEILPWPASGRQYRALVDKILSGLRNGYAVTDLDGWVYRAWNENTHEPLVLPKLGLPRRPPPTVST